MINLALGAAIVAIWILTYRWRERVAARREYDAALDGYLNALKLGVSLDCRARCRDRFNRAWEALKCCH